ncbi:sporulation protein YunB [Paenibacillus mesotrionivorans]|jgi:sporulation protein YunB|uniref:Sporulation protein YunB n=1 Tax=Paenibacillus mesotrionivorans TaxID=3160968 RepID=A0ACC7P0P0_9BACL
MQKRGFYGRPPRRKRRRRVVFLLLLITMAFALQSFIFVEKNLKPPLMNLAKVRVKQIATQAINSAITDRLSQGANYDKLIEWQRDNNGNVSSFVLNYAEHMRITADTVSTVQNQLLQLKSMPEHIPLGQAMGSALLASFGPKVPVRLVPMGSAQVSLNTRYENAGINMILVEVYIRIIAEVSVIIPFDSKPEVVETEIPVTYVLVVGGTPMYYMDNKGNPVGGSSALPPSVSLPQLKEQSGSSLPMNSKEK